MDINTVNASSATTAKIDIGFTPVKLGAAKDVELDNRASIKAVEEAEKAQAEQSKPEEQDKQELQNLVDELSDMMSVMRKGLAFKIDEDSGTNIVSVLDIDSGDIIRQIPNEEALKLAQKLSEVTGLLMKTEA
ncbi:flagellar biosynthesis protein FlaG [Shewanella colwelliana]|uniref:Flagellar biosynthesis protein FlaG n=1 Tax=Shewanella colwelliana TaxID=23 RepID=A0A1E5IVM6_SHECO|nr:flagellar protein FlaG [Shewanella colwelliana]OEG74585.1 flagellar biosynthesis protein FlaG [Shewanella colwelliana]